MGGGKKKKAGGYVHVQTANPSARESDDRRAALQASMEVKRLEKAVERQEERMRAFVPDHLRKKSKIDPLYDLKGAARPAREFYRDPNYAPEPEPEDLLSKYSTEMWSHEEGQVLCRLRAELGVALHNIGNQARRAAAVLSALLEADPEDHMNAKLLLLRCYLDNGDSANARSLLDRFSDNTSVPFSFGRVLIECIALMLNEPDASRALVDDAIRKANIANPFAIWVFAHYDVFEVAVDFVDEIVAPAAGSVEEALLSGLDDIELWNSVDGAVDTLKQYIKRHRLPYPVLPEPLDAVSASVGERVGAQEEGDDGKHESSPEEQHDMYVGMFRTALEMIEENRQNDK